MTLHSISVKAQYAASGDDPLRVLIVGAGIAGITAAQMLRIEGWHPVLIERSPDERHPGYMLALMPMVDSLIRDLDVRESYHEASVPLARYRFLAHTGKTIRTDSMTGILERYGDYRGIGRPELMHVLTSKGCDVTFDTTVSALDETPRSVTVSLTSGSETGAFEFDLVIVADGIRSKTRALIPGSAPVEVVDSGWGGWVVWAPADSETDLGDELWGAGFFLGAYPVKDRLGVFLGGALADTATGPQTFVEGARKRLKTVTPRVDSALRSVADEADPYFWPLNDCRAAQWTTARTVLLGDSAAGFLPTAGIGAGMAMESAWVLTRMLRHVDTVGLAPLLREYERAQRPRVEAAQNTSRGLAKLMFRRSRVLAVIRDIVMRLLSVDVALRPIQRLLQNPPEPDRIATDLLTASARPSS